MRKYIFTLLLSFGLLFTAVDSYSQCAMCRRVAETGKSGDSKRGLNAGIMYLLSIPYILGGVGVFVWYKNRKKE